MMRVEIKPGDCGRPRVQQTCRQSQGFHQRHQGVERLAGHLQGHFSGAIARNEVKEVFWEYIS